MSLAWTLLFLLGVGHPAAHSLQICPVCTHMVLTEVYPQVPFLTTVFNTKNNSACEPLDKANVVKHACEHMNEDPSEAWEYRCSYTHGELKGQAPGINGLVINITMRACVKVPKDSNNGCFENKDDPLVLDTLGFIPGVSDTSFAGQTCSCSTDMCNAAPCPQNHHTVPYFGEYGYCVHLYILIGIGGGSGVLIVILLFVCCFCCPWCTPDKDKKLQGSKAASQKKTIYTATTRHYPDMPPHYIGSVDRVQYHGNPFHESQSRFNSL